MTGSLIPLPTNPGGIGNANPSALQPGATTLLTVAVTAGQNPTSSAIAVNADLSSIGGLPDQVFFDDGTHGDVTGGDLVFSFEAPVAPGTPAGNKSLLATIRDAQLRSSTAGISLGVFSPAGNNVVISQVYGGGGNSEATYTNDFIELYNRGAVTVDVSGWSVQYASSGGSSWTPTAITGLIAPGTYYLVQEAAGAGGTTPLPTPDATGAIAMSGTQGKVALVASTAALSGACPVGETIADLVGYGGASCFEGTGAAPALSNTTAAVRLNGGATDTNQNNANFIAGPPEPRSSIGISPHGTGTATPASLDSGDASLLTVAVTPGRLPASTGLTVATDLAAIGGLTAQPFFNDGTHGDVTAGDAVFSFQATVTGTSGVKPIVATVSDLEGRSSTTDFSVTIQPPPIAIHAIQGNGLQSPLVGTLVTTTGIVTAVRPTSYYVQAPDAEHDADPSSSEGLLAFGGSRPAGLAAGDLVRVTGTVIEFRPSADPGSPPITELGGPATTVVSTGNPLPAPVILLPSFTTATGGFEQLERFEGMRVIADVEAISGTQSFSRTDADEQNAASTSNGDFFAVIRGVPRPMREPGIDITEDTIPASPCCIPAFDGNPERLRVDSDGQINAAKIEIVAGQTIAGLIGVLDYGFRSYTIVPDPRSWVPQGNGAAVPVPVPNDNEFTVGAFNMERFFDDVNDGISEPVLTTAAFERRLSKASLAIRHVMRTPDVLGVEEVENLRTLDLLGQRINADAAAAGEPDPQYAAYLEEGNDIGGIDSGFLVKSARVDVLSVTQAGKSATYAAPGGGTPLLNDRPPVFLDATIHAPGGLPYRVTVVVNHLRSLSGIIGSDAARIRAKRLAQAEFLANELQARQSSRVISVGDYNAFQFSDGYVHVLGSVIGAPAAPDTVVVTGPDLVTPDYINLGDGLGAEQYSYVFGGNAQTLDHILVNRTIRPRFTRIFYARNNAGFPESLRNDGTRSERLSDHDMPVAYFTFPGAPTMTLNGLPTMTVECHGTFEDPGAWANDDELGALPVTVSGTVDTSRCGSYELTYSADNGFHTTTLTRIVNVVDTTTPTLALNGVPAMTIPLGSSWSDPGATANDACAGDLTDVIQVTGAVNRWVSGVYSLTYRVSDGFNTATVTRTVTVVDTVAPLMTPVLVAPSSIRPASGRMVDVVVLYLAIDLSGAPSCSLAVTSNEPATGPGDTTPIDWQVLGPYHVRVRAERSGGGSGRTYTITATCRDTSGNATARSATVRVPR